MFFMYGGSLAEGFNEGPFDMYDGAFIASTRNVIVVTINYRLGPFGFVVTDHINGNMVRLYLHIYIYIYIYNPKNMRREF